MVLSNYLWYDTDTGALPFGHHDIQHNDTHQDVTQHIGLNKHHSLQALSVITLFLLAMVHIILLSVIMLSVVATLRGIKIERQNIFSTDIMVLGDSGKAFYAGLILC